MWWPYRFRDAAAAADPTGRVRAFAAAVASEGDTFVEASARTNDGGIDVWFRAPQAPSEACGTAWLEALRAGGLTVERLKGRN